MDDAQVLNRAGQGHVEQAQSAPVIAGDGRGFDHDHGVELQSLGRRSRDDGDGPGHGVALEDPDPALSPGQPGDLGRQVLGDDHRHQCMHLRQGGRLGQRGGRHLALADEMDRGIGASGAYGRGGLDPGSGDPQEREAKSSTRPGAR